MGSYPGTELRPWPETVEELRNNEDYWYSGSHSILDIQRVVDTTRPPKGSNDDYSTVRPLSRDRLRRLFGTEKPTPAQFEALNQIQPCSNGHNSSRNPVAPRLHQEETSLHLR